MTSLRFLVFGSEPQATQSGGRNQLSKDLSFFLQLGGEVDRSHRRLNAKGQATGISALPV